MLKPVVLLVLFSSLIPSFSHAAPAKCPVINGTYVMRKEIDGVMKKLSFTRATRIANGVFSYTINKKGDYQVADGVARPIFNGELEGRTRLSCEDGTLKQESWTLGNEEKTTPFTNLYMALSSTELLLESNDSRLSGIYSKQD